MILFDHNTYSISLFLPLSHTSTAVLLTLAPACLSLTDVSMCMCRTTMENTRCLQIAEKRQQERVERESDVCYASPSSSLSRNGTTPPPPPSNASSLASPYGTSSPAHIGGGSGHEDSSRAMARAMMEENQRLAMLRSMNRAQEKRTESEQARRDAEHWDRSSQFYR